MIGNFSFFEVFLGAFVPRFITSLTFESPCKACISCEGFFGEITERCVDYVILCVMCEVF